jgi:hypothetical protein
LKIDQTSREGIKNVKLIGVYTTKSIDKEKRKIEVRSPRLLSFVKRLPAGNGMAFVLVQHLDPTYESSLTKIISAATKLAVVEAAEGMPIENI